jgi:hypothetical protein
MMNVRDLIALGIEKRVEADARHEASLPTAMRFGNSGAIIGGKVYGNCPRLAHLRLLGFQPANDKATQVMFASGRAVESVIYDFLACSIPPERIKRESEAAVKYEHTGSGIPITGRPDFIILNEKGEYETGIECKGKMSYWGLKGLIIDGKGDAAHLIQAAHYMFQHKLKSYALVYVCPTKFLVPEGGPEWPRDLISKSGRGWATNTALFTVQLDTAPNGTLRVEMHDGAIHNTKLKPEHIESYYGAIANMGPGKPLPPAPTSAGLFGKPSYKKCDYCPLRDVCDSTSNYEEWLDRSIDIITESWQKEWPNLLPLYLTGWKSVDE